MRTLGQAGELKNAGQPVHTAIGMFDGVHLGHQTVIARMTAQARAQTALAVVVSFDRHPSTVVAPERTPLLIQTLAQRLRAIAALDVDATWVIPFDRAFSQQTGETFVRALALGFAPLRSICVGDQFHFGYRRSGNMPLLERLGPELGFSTCALPAVTSEGEPVSSTRIRERVRAGDLTGASRLLGRRYALAGNVMAGDRLGRQLGFPTANLGAEGLAIPPPGVYVAQARLETEVHPAVVNIGVRPTLAQPQPRLQVEAHLLDFAGNLYGRELELVFLGTLRPEQKFADLQALQRQIQLDVRTARQWFANGGPDRPGPP